MGIPLHLPELMFANSFNAIMKYCSCFNTVLNVQYILTNITENRQQAVKKGI